MTNKEFQKKLTQKNIEELAEERVRAVLSNNQGVEALFKRYYDFFDDEELKLFKNIITEALLKNRSTDSEDFTSDQELLKLFCVFSTAKDAMRDLVILMVNEMREENDYAGLAELHDDVLRLPYDLYIPLAFIVFHNLYETLDVFCEEGRWYQSFSKVFNSHFIDLRKQADNEWAACQQSASAAIDSAQREITRELLHDLWEKHSIQKDVLVLSKIEKREILSLGYLMMLTKILRDEVLSRTNNLREQNDYIGLAKMLETLDTMDGISDERRQKCAGLLLGGAEV